MAILWEPRISFAFDFFPVSSPTRRIDLLVSIGYGDGIAKAKETLIRLTKEDSRILAESTPAIAVLELGATSINLAVRPWVNTPDYWEVRLLLRKKSRMNLTRRGSAFHFPSRRCIFL